MNVLEHLEKYGPSRVLVDAEGTAVSFQRAMRDHAVMPRVVFVRGDGWTLGAPRGLEETARTLWAEDWVGWVQMPLRELRPMSEWPP